MRVLRAIAFVATGIVALMYGLRMPTSTTPESLAQSCPSGCIAGKPGSLVVKRRGFVGIKSSKQYVPRSDARAFPRESEAVGAGFTEYVAPDATPTPTPTPTPTITSVEGRYATGSTTPLTRVSGSDTCDDSGFTQAAAVSVDIEILHDIETDVARGEEVVTWPGGVATPVPVGPRYWGGVTSSTQFEVSDTFPASVSCTNPYISRQYAFTSVDEDSATVTRTDRILCLGNNPVIDCRQVWTGDVGRAN